MTETLTKSNEALEPDSNFPNLLELTPRQEAKLERELAQTHGIARALVHPLYCLDEQDLADIDQGRIFYNKNDKSAKKYVEGVKRLLAKTGQEQAPVFIFESQSNLVKTLKYLASSLQNCSVYLVPTWDHDPYPVIGKKNDDFVDRYINDLAGLGSILKDYGLTKMIVAGKQLWFPRARDYPKPRSAYHGTAPVPRYRSNSPDAYAAGCVGALANIFYREGIAIDFSNIAR